MFVSIAFCNALPLIFQGSWYYKLNKDKFNKMEFQAE